MTGPAPLQSSLLAAEPGVRHAFFTRQGGVSTGLYAGLNVGRGSRDDPAAVEANRAVCAVLAETLRVPNAAVTVTLGQTSRDKTLHVAGDAALLSAKLETL